MHQQLQAELGAAEASASNMSGKTAALDCQVASCQAEVAKLQAALEQTCKAAEQASALHHPSLLVLPRLRPVAQAAALSSW